LTNEPDAMPVSIYDIAKQANVSPSTVSRALQDHPRIAAETKRRIVALAGAMGYVPSAVARSLTSNQTWTIGVVLASVSDPFTGRVVEGVEQAALEAGFGVLLSTSQYSREREAAAVEALRRRRIDGIVVMSSHLFARSSPAASQVAAPVVVINEQDPGEGQHVVSVDDAQGAWTAVEHLLALGHRRIGYVGAGDRPKSNRSRLRGFHAALAAAGVPPDAVLVLPGDAQGDHARAGAESLGPLLAAGATAAFCYNDATAIGLLSACYARRVAVPADLSVVGFDDIDAAAYSVPPLTTVRQPRFEMGRRAVQMVLALLRGEQPPNERLAAELVVRDTTAPH
jgi:DNA-binding LacI/PurR family transcriptional regulator